MKKIYLLLISVISFTAFSQDKPAQEDTKVYNTVGLDVMPEFPGGVMAFKKIFETGIDKSSIKGPSAKIFKVYVSFIIEKDGTMTDKKVLRDTGFDFGKQVLVLLEKTKDKWSPGKIGGKAVRVLYYLPVTIKKEDNHAKFEEIKISEAGDITIDKGIAGTLDKGVEVPEDESNHIYRMSELQVQPEYPGGVERLKEDVQKAITPADKGAPKGTILKAYVSFIVEKDGAVSNVKILRDPGYGFGKEIERSVRKVRKKWTPGQLKGKKVRVEYTLPIEINTEKYQSGPVSDRGIGDNVATPYEDDYLEKKKENKIHVMPDLDEGPKFPGGNDNFTKEFDKRFDKKILTGNVSVGVDFVLEKDGTLTFKIMKSGIDAVDAETTRVLNTMPKWTPGKINGQPVRCAFSQRFYIRK